MKDDPIVAAVREIREKLAEAFSYDVHAVFADIRSRESQSHGKLIQTSNESDKKPVVAPSGSSPGLDVDNTSHAS